MEPTGSSRRLSAILMADVVGYSRLMGRDEDETVRRLKAFRQVFSDNIGKTGGRDAADQPGRTGTILGTGTRGRNLQPRPDQLASRFAAVFGQSDHRRITQLILG